MIEYKAALVLVQYDKMYISTIFLLNGSRTDIRTFFHCKRVCKILDYSGTYVKFTVYLWSMNLHIHCTQVMANQDTKYEWNKTKEISLVKINQLWNRYNMHHMVRW